jgi:hypothetical protein
VRRDKEKIPVHVFRRLVAREGSIDREAILDSLGD